MKRWRVGVWLHGPPSVKCIVAADTLFFLNRTTYLQTSVLGNELTVVPGYRLVLTFLIKADLARLQQLQTVN